MAKKTLQDTIEELDYYSLHILVAAIDTIREYIGDDYKNTAKIHNAIWDEINKRKKEM